MDTVRHGAGQVICGQCRRQMRTSVAGSLATEWDDWTHTDGTPRCPQGATAAVRITCAALAAAGGYPVWISDGRPRWMTPTKET